MFVDCPFSFLQLPVHIPPTSLQVLSRKEFDDNWEEFSSGSVVVHWTSSNGYLVRLFFKHTCLHLILHFASQISFQELLIHNQDSPYQDSGDSSSMFVVFGFDSIFKVWFMCIGLAFYSWLFLTVFLIIFRGRTLFISMYVSWFTGNLTKCTSCITSQRYDSWVTL